MSSYMQMLGFTYDKAFDSGQKHAKQKLLSAIQRRVKALDPEDGESFVMYGKFERLINEIL